ncbi:MAG: hypothetical protein J1E02_02495 [Coprobacter sp.]|nr:hypothetical protein [Coprobacter sp.]
MKIITPRNNKDFYDYLTGIYGIDEKVVFDRRVFNVLKSSDSPLFSTIKRPEDREKVYWEYAFDEVENKHFDRPVGSFIYSLLEAGNHWYIFRTERYLDDYGKVHIDWCFIKKIVVDKKMHSGDTPLTLYPNLGIYGWRSDTPIFIKKHDLKNGIANPIIKDTPITSFVKADDVYQGIYAYISSLNDIDYTDNRNDIQKLESAGFDKKTSFRNIK